MRQYFIFYSSLSVLVWAQQPPPAPTGVVLIRLTDSVSGQPIAGASASVVNFGLPAPKFFAGRTNEEGVSRIERVLPGTYTVQLQKMGYVFWLDAQRPSITVAAGVNPEVKLRLDPTAAVEGVVLGDDKEPLAGVSIYAVPSVGSPLHAESGHDGRFKVEFLPPGPVRFRLLVPSDRIKAALRVEKSGGGRFSYPPSSFHPGVESASQAAVMTLSPGVTLTGLELRVRRERLAELKGRLLDAVTKLPLLDGEVELQAQGQASTVDEAFRRRQVSGPQAQFHFPFVRPGTHHLLIYRGSKLDSLPYAVDLEVGAAGLLDQVVRVPSFSRITGRLSPASVGRVSLAEHGDRTGANVGPDGRFSLEGVPPGSAAVYVDLPDRRYYARRITLAGREAEPNGWGHRVDIPEGSAEMEIMISDEAGVVAGRVVDEKDNPVPNKRIIVPVPGLSGALLKTDQFGNFRLEGVPPGKREFRVCPGKGEWVEVAAGATAAVTLHACP